MRAYRSFILCENIPASSADHPNLFLSAPSSLEELTFEIYDWDIDDSFCYSVIKKWVEHNKNLRKLVLKIRLRYGNRWPSNVAPAHDEAFQLFHDLKAITGKEPMSELFRNELRGDRWELLVTRNRGFEWRLTCEGGPW